MCRLIFPSFTPPLSSVLYSLFSLKVIPAGFLLICDLFFPIHIIFEIIFIVLCPEMILGYNKIIFSANYSNFCICGGYLFSLEHATKKKQRTSELTGG